MSRLILLLALLLACGACGGDQATSIVRMEQRLTTGESSWVTVDERGGVRRDDREQPPLSATALRELRALLEVVPTLPAPADADPNDGIERTLIIGDQRWTITGIPSVPEPTRQLVRLLAELLAAP